MKHSVVHALVMALGLALSAPAQTLQEPQAETSAVEESIDVRVVNVEAVVTAGSGERVRGLSAADFRLLVDGQEVPVEYFTEVEEGTAAAVAPGALVAQGEEVGRSYLVYVDESFSLPTQRNTVLEKLERDLSLLRSSDRMSLVAFTGSRLEVLCGWTGDTERLRHALAEARRRSTRGNQQLSYQRSLDSDVIFVLASAESIETPSTGGMLEPSEMAEILSALAGRIPPEARTQLGKTTAATAATLRGLETPPGRKVMLLLSGAWSLTVAPQLYGPVVTAANRLGYTVYPVDAARSDPAQVTMLDNVARTTGGRAIVSATGDVFRQVVADSGSYYWLGFTPSWKADDRRHQVQVEVRRAGLAVRSRSGFSDSSRHTETAMKAEGVLLFGGAAADRRLIVQLGEAKRRGRELEIPVTLGVPVESLALRPHGQGYLAEVPLAVIAQDERGGRADLPALRLQVAIAELPKPGTYARFQTAMNLRNRKQQLVFTVHDAVSGRTLWGEAKLAPKK